MVGALEMKRFGGLKIEERGGGKQQDEGHRGVIRADPLPYDEKKKTTIPITWRHILVDVLSGNLYV